MGAATGGLIGSLTGAGVSEADARMHEEGVNAGGTLVTVRVEDSQAAQVEQIMGMNAGATHDSSTMGAGMATGAGMGMGALDAQPISSGTRIVGASTTEAESTARRDAEAGRF